MQFNRSIAAIATAFVALCAPAAFGEKGILLSDATAADSSSLATGKQLLLTGLNGGLAFAGSTISVSGFTGLVGYANELAYVLVIDGTATAQGKRAAAGSVLILRPYGAPATVEQFDAIRLSRQWSDAAKTAAPSAFASLESIKASQELGVWFGRLGQTNFNVAASGSARSEKATRTLLGDPAVRELRFSGESGARALEEMVVTRFINALKAGDTRSVAALLDPTPFGGQALDGGADGARLLAASTLIASRNWADAAGAHAPQLESGAWRTGTVSLELRAIDDFVFVKRVSGGAK